MNDLYISKNYRVGMVAYTCNLGTLEVEAVWSVLFCFFFNLESYGIRYLKDF